MCADLEDLKRAVSELVCAELENLKRGVSGIVGCSHITPRGEGCSYVERCWEADAVTGTGGLHGCWVLCAQLWCGLCCLLQGFWSGCSAAVGLCRDEGGFNPVGRHCDEPAVYGDPHRFLCASQEIVRDTVWRFQGAVHYILPEEDMG